MLRAHLSARVLGLDHPENNKAPSVIAKCIPRPSGAFPTTLDLKHDPSRNRAAPKMCMRVPSWIWTSILPRTRYVSVVVTHTMNLACQIGDMDSSLPTTHNHRASDGSFVPLSLASTSRHVTWSPRASTMPTPTPTKMTCTRSAKRRTRQTPTRHAIGHAPHNLLEEHHHTWSKRTTGSSFSSLIIDSQEPALPHQAPQLLAVSVLFDGQVAVDVSVVCVRS